MPPQSTVPTDASEIGQSIYSSPSPTTATSPLLASATSISTSDDDEQDGEGNRVWSNYLYIIVIIAVVFLLFGFLYQRKRRGLYASTFPRQRFHAFQAFHTHHPSQSRDLAAVHANNRVWRNMRAGPFSHHARSESASMRPMRPSSSIGRSRVDVDDDVPPPYVPAEPERTLDRGPSTRDLRAERRGRNEPNLEDQLRGREEGLMSKPPGYESHVVERRDG